MTFKVNDRIQISYNCWTSYGTIPKGSAGVITDVAFVHGIYYYRTKFKCGPTVELVEREFDLYIPHALEQLAEIAE